MSIRIRRRTSGGATLVEMTMVLVIIAVLVMIQIQGGLKRIDQVERTVQQAGMMRPAAPGLEVSRGYRAAPAGQWKAELRQTLHQGEKKAAQLKSSATVAMRRAADWMEEQQARRKASGQQVCVGQFCV